MKLSSKLQDPDVTITRTPTATHPPMGPWVETTTIDYVYDSLYRLKEANYSDGRYFHYTYDWVGNRLSEEKCLLIDGCEDPLSPTTTTYTYDNANRLTHVNGSPYTWDDNGNLLDDGTNTYTYDAANRLTSVNDGLTPSAYAYNGLGDRLSQTVDSVTTDYVLDLNTGLTQVLDDGTNTYLYGNGRIGELQPGGFAYHLGDALGSVRQLTDDEGDVTLAKSYEPFGSALSSEGEGSSTFAFTGEQWDSQTGLTYLRARYYGASAGRFIQKDPWYGNTQSPITLNKYIYGNSNPLIYTDPSGMACVLGQNVGWLGGNACTDEDRQWTAESLTKVAQTLANSAEMQLGMWIEFVDTFGAGTPSLIINTVDQLITPYSPLRQFIGINCNDDFAFKSVYEQLIVERKSPQFQFGRLVGRVAALAISGAELGTGAGANALSLLAAFPSGGVSLGGLIAGSAVAIHGIAVMGVGIYKEAVDPLILKAGQIIYAAMSAANPGNGGASSGGLIQQQKIAKEYAQKAKRIWNDTGQLANDWGFTIAVTKYKGKLYAAINGNASAIAIRKFLEVAKSNGIEAIVDTAHAEPNLVRWLLREERFKVTEMGISQGPCPDFCQGFLQDRGIVSAFIDSEGIMRLFP